MDLPLSWLHLWNERGEFKYLLRFTLCSFPFIVSHLILTKVLWGWHFTNVKTEAWATKQFFQGHITIRKRGHDWNTGQYGDKALLPCSLIHSLWCMSWPLPLVLLSVSLGKEEKYLPTVRFLLFFFGHNLLWKLYRELWKPKGSQKSPVIWGIPKTKQNKKT